MPHPLRTPPPAGWQPPARSYAICTTPRSGSTYLCRLLRASGQAGTPDEHFGEGRNEAARRQGPAAWIGEVVAANLGGNGTFGCKLFPPHHHALREEAGIHLPDWLPGLTFIHLRRRDLLGQAISFAIASQTDQWLSSQPAATAREPRYDYRLIGRLLDRLVEWEAYWRRYFALAEITPLELVYDELAADPGPVLNRLLTALGLPPDPAAAVPSRGLGVKPQRTDRNEAWRARFLAELDERGYSLTDRPQRSRPGLRSLGDWLGGRLSARALYTGRPGR